MGLIDGMRGNASKVDAGTIATDNARLLGPGEVVEHAYQLVRDLFLFTDRRLILIDKQGISGKKVDYTSIPYKSITRFSVETAGTFDLDAELKIWTSGVSEPIGKQFSKQVDIYEVQAVLAQYVCCK